MQWRLKGMARQDIIVSEKVVECDSNDSKFNGPSDNCGRGASRAFFIKM